VSLYLDINPLSHLVEGQETRIERVNIAATCAIIRWRRWTQPFSPGRNAANCRSSRTVLPVAARARTEAARGKPATQQDRVDYNFTSRTSASASSSAGAGHRWTSWWRTDDQRQQQLGRCSRPRRTAIYRTQSNGKVRMTTWLPAPGLACRITLASSPLRRYIDLLNQWQLLPASRGSAAIRKELRRSARGNARIRTQPMPHTTSSRQNGALLVLALAAAGAGDPRKAQVLRDNLVNSKEFRCIYAYIATGFGNGQPVLPGIEGIDLIDNAVKTRYKGLVER